jgi:type VI secretion system Hcp family effector
MAAGKRRHAPITIWKEVDQASPVYFQALLSKEPLDLKIDLGNEGCPRPNYSMALSGGVVSGIRHVPPSTHGKDRVKFEMEEVQFVFEMIEVTWNDGGITASGDWSAQV